MWGSRMYSACKQRTHFSVSLSMILIVGSVISVACNNHTHNSKRLNNTNRFDSVTGHFIGMFPCADCSGLRMDLTLKPDSSYILKRTYVASPSGDTTFVVKGRWTLKTGNKYQSFCVLNPGDSLRMELFEIITADSLLQVDREGRKINSPFNESLTRVNGL